MIAHAPRDTTFACSFHNPCSYSSLGGDHRGNSYDRQRLAVFFVLKESIQASAIPVYFVVNAILIAEIGGRIDIQLHIVPLK